MRPGLLWDVRPVSPDREGGTAPSPIQAGVSGSCGVSEGLPAGANSLACLRLPRSPAATIMHGMPGPRQSTQTPYPLDPSHRQRTVSTVLLLSAAKAGWNRLILGLACAGALAGCGTATLRPATAVTPAVAAMAAPAEPVTPPKPAVELSVQVQLEPNDYSHRNYCAEGAISVLLSTWSDAVPSIDDIGVSAHVSETRGTRGPDAEQAINHYLGQITGTEKYAYSKSYVTSPAILKAMLESDLSGLGRFTHGGHGSPVVVHVWTATLPGWSGWQASHAIAVFGYDFAPGNPSGDTVTYAETSSSVAGYTGPQVQTISLDALWAATQTPSRAVSFRDAWTVIA